MHAQHNFMKRLYTALKKDWMLVLVSLIVGFVLAQLPIFSFLGIGAVGDTFAAQVINFVYDIFWCLTLGSWVFYIPFRFTQNKLSKKSGFQLAGLFVKVVQFSFFIPSVALVRLFKPPRLSS